MRARVHVAVIGAGVADEATSAAAEEVGRLLAEAGAVVVCGGLSGVMEAVCRGAKAAGGWTIGILPGDRRDAANEFVDVAIPTAMGEGRNLMVVRTADVVIAVGGEYGTLSEIGLALKLGRPVVGLGTWSLTRGDGTVDDGVVPASDPSTAVAAALALAAAG